MSICNGQPSLLTLSDPSWRRGLREIIYLPGLWFVMPRFSLVMDAVSSKFDNLRAAVVIAVFAWAAVALFSVGRRKHLPPGPRGWPVIGNILDLPKAHAWKAFAAWSNRWGKFSVQFYR